MASHMVWTVIYFCIFHIFSPNTKRGNKQFEYLWNFRQAAVPVRFSLKLKHLESYALSERYDEEKKYRPAHLHKQPGKRLDTSAHV